MCECVYVSVGCSVVFSSFSYTNVSSENCQWVCVTLTGRNSDAGRDADTVVNDSKHVDVVLHSRFQARDGAGGHIAWNPNL